MQRTSAIRAVVAAVAVAVAVAAPHPMRAADTATTSDSGPPLSTLSPTAFPEAVRAGDVEAIVDTFADDIVFDSPILPEPFVGLPVVTRLFGVLVDTLAGLTIIDELYTPDRLVLYIRATVNGAPIEIIDLIEFDESGHIGHVVATSRPIGGTNALAEAMAPHLGEILGS